MKEGEHLAFQTATNVIDYLEYSSNLHLEKNFDQKYLLNKSEWMCVGWKTGVRIGEIWGKGTGPDGKDSLKFI